MWPLKAVAYFTSQDTLKTVAVVFMYMTSRHKTNISANESMYRHTYGRETHCNSNEKVIRLKHADIPSSISEAESDSACPHNNSSEAWRVAER